MKLSGVLSVLSIATSALVTADQQNAFQLSQNNEGAAQKQWTNQLAVTDETPFCKMDKDENLGPGCDVTIAEINNINKKIRKDIVSLVNTDFFKYFKFDPFKKCTFWENNEGICFSRSCAVDVVEDWDKLPEYWQPEVLGSLENDSTNETETHHTAEDDASFLNELCNSKNDKMNQLESNNDLNYYDINDFLNEDAVLVDLSKNPERFTGYGGQEAGQIWKSIYAENCFSSDEADTCLAKDAFYRIVSGLHASIGTHLSNDHLDTTTGEWGPDLDLFMARVGNFPERVSNVYFNYAIVAKSLWKIKPYLKELDFCNDYDNDVKQKIINIVSQLDSKIFDEDLMFKDDYDASIKDDFRSRFKNVTKLMDCVHCDRCKMWGKVQTTGYATSLKILFELNEADEESKQQVVNRLTKFELISLLNTFNRLSTSIESINNFETLYDERVNGEDNQGAIANFFQNNNFFKLIEKAKDSFIDKCKKLNGSNDTSENVIDLAVEEEEEAEESKFQDLKMPKKKPQQKKKNTTQKNNISQDSTADENVWARAWRTEIHNTREAFRFIYRSYLDLPKNLGNMLLVNFNKVWNRFVGVQDYLNEEEQDPSVYKLDLH
ncbi:similar to Saccharomyces cerevisiae YML130C ERO1 Thiol oxidase required for oxidative protein folding in the endoplasmic reticulum [Maudiozyma saulgeensis]|uniref:Similar to Saccharomyces cerevisiae YML130C ERO1 Thiol oxidase required for oxidative protein folding in the endoplasmic reticulum n=1 Tax=Maudiozyma saulgeensis TaxID=1789683 RepID=A0A1X7R4G3_9SACH|nr:similar to Saccharomyces cerevisiae YML130C ERO1 Thiol oxidase required for oxidative protein folding in the endoplasmic reticulum [Kazachstania saulgeensis]